MPRQRDDDATRVRFQRSTEWRAGEELIQVWKSELTGREFEVKESRSYARSEELRRGAEGYMDFASGLPAVTKRPLERHERLRRYQRRARAEGSRERSGDRRGGSLGGWLLVGALLAVIVWALL